MEKALTSSRTVPQQKAARGFRDLASDDSGAVLIEAAFVLGILVVLLGGVVTYGLWFMSAHSLQQVANEGARASLGGLDAKERAALVQRAVDRSLLQATLVDPEEVTVETATDENFFTVSLTYDASENAIFNASLVPVPSDTIIRKATIELQTY